MPPLMKYLFSYHSIKIDPVFIEKKLEYPLYIKNVFFLLLFDFQWYSLQWGQNINFRIDDGIKVN
jgi:hypothetical protein